MANAILFEMHREFERRLSREGQTQLERLQAVMKQSARKETASPRHQPDWHHGDPLLGHEWLTAFVVQDLFGGELKLAERNGKGGLLHIVMGTMVSGNLVVNGEVTALTPMDERIKRDELLASKAGVRDRLERRYRLFAGNVHITMALLLR